VLILSPVFTGLIFLKQFEAVNLLSAALTFCCQKLFITGDMKTKAWRK